MERSALVLLGVTAMTVACGGPFLVIPGGELSGEVVTEPVSDWSFVDDPFVDLETRPGAPYSVELNYVVKEGQLYIDPAEGRRWFDYIREDPRVRARFGGKISAWACIVSSTAARPSRCMAIEWAPSGVRSDLASAQAPPESSATPARVMAKRQDGADPM